jgi:hypothetical protein
LGGLKVIKQINYSYFINFVVILLSIVFSIKFILLSSGDLINHYPYITPDGFDWYVEGMYISAFINGDAVGPLNVLRPPFFVFITYLDYVFGGAGYVIGPLIGLTFVVNFYLISALLKNEKLNLNSIKIIILICIFFMPINYIKPYLLADSMAISLSLASFYFLIKHFCSKRQFFLVIGLLLSILAAITQLYAVIPSVLVIFYYYCKKMFARKAIFNQEFIYLLSLVIIIFTILYTWRNIIPHNQTPANFSLLKLSTNMFDFYVATWFYFYFPFIVLFLFNKLKINILSSKVFLLSFIFVTFNILIFSYQWPETRFTTYAWYFGLLLFLFNIDLSSNFKVKTLVLIFVAICFCGTSNYWAISKENISFSYRFSWVYDFMKSDSLNRNFDAKNHSIYYLRADPYSKNSIDLYRQIILLKRPLSNNVQ